MVVGLTTIIAFIGWGLLDRMHWATVEGIVYVDKGRLDLIEKRLETIPKDPVSRQEHIDLVNRIDQQHTETVNDLHHLSDQIYSLALGSRARVSKSFGVDEEKQIPAVVPPLKVK